MPMASVIDTHFHVWDPSLLDIPWLGGSVPVLNRAYDIDDYLLAAGDKVPEQSVYVEVNVAPDQRLLEYESVLKLIHADDNPLSAAVMAANPMDATLDEWIDRAQQESCVRGFRFILHSSDRPRGLCLDSSFVHGVQRIGEAGLHFELCMRTDELDDAIQLAEVAPETTLVLNHCGYPKLDGRDLTEWRGRVERLANCSNVVCKVSGLFENAEPDWDVEQFRPVIEYVRSVFGVDRLLFGSNWPVCNLVGSYRQWMDVVTEVIAHWPEEDQDALLSGNAKRIYQLR